MTLTANHAKHANNGTEQWLPFQRQIAFRVVRIVRGSLAQVAGLNQLTTAPDGACSYDGNGNLISSGATALEHAYDDENQLSIVQSNTVFYSTNYPLWQVLYAYDGLGRLRLRVERQNMVIPDPGGGGEEALMARGDEESLVAGGGTTWSTNSVTEYIYDGWRVIQERNGSNVPAVSYTRGTDLSGSLEGAGGIGGLLARSHGYSSGNWSTHNFYHADGNGNVTYLVNSSQTLAASYRYDPYGNTISSSGSMASANTYRFSSKEIHLNTGLYYYGYRWYSPNLQRWINKDPIGELGGVNLYGYVGNDPMNFIDPSGFEKISKGIVALLNSANAGRLYGLGMIKVAIGSGVEVTGVGAAPGAATIGWGLWNLKGADAAYKRGLKQWNECKSEQWGWNSKNLWGLAPFGASMDDDDELSPIDVARGIGRNLEGNPKEFISASTEYLWKHVSEILGEWATLSF